MKYSDSRPKPAKALKTHPYGVTVEHGGAVLLNCKLPLELHPNLGGIEEAARRGAELVRERRALLAGAELRVTIDPPDRRTSTAFAVTLGAQDISVRPWQDQLDIEAWLTGAVEQGRTQGCRS